MNIGYFRVSKENETLQDLDIQIEKVKEKFNLTKLKIFKERGSAYNLKKIHKRLEFKKLLEYIFDSDVQTINDLFFGTSKNKETISLYIWDYSRIIRNIELNVMFSLLADKYNVNIYSYKQPIVLKRIDETPSEKMIRILLSTIQAFSSEEYSYNISENVKKVVKREKGITSSKERTWGTGLKRDGAKLSIEETIRIKGQCKILIKNYERRGYKRYYKKLIKIIKDTFDLDISKSTLSRWKKELK